MNRPGENGEESSGDKLGEIWCNQDVSFWTFTEVESCLAQAQDGLF